MTEKDYKDQIVTNLGDSAGHVEDNIDLIWDIHRRFWRKPYLRFLYTERDAIRLLIGNNRSEAEPPPGGDGDSESSLDAERNRFNELRALLTDINDEIKSLGSNKTATKNRYATGRLLCQSPYPALPGRIDPSDLRYYPDARRNARRER